MDYNSILIVPKLDLIKYYQGSTWSSIEQPQATHIFDQWTTKLVVSTVSSV